MERDIAFIARMSHREAFDAAFHGGIRNENFAEHEGELERTSERIIFLAGTQSASHALATVSDRRVSPITLQPRKAMDQLPTVTNHIVE